VISLQNWMAKNANYCKLKGYCSYKKRERIKNSKNGDAAMVLCRLEDSCNQQTDSRVMELRSV